MKCDNGGYIIESEKYNHNQVGKQARYNTIAKGLRVATKQAEQNCENCRWFIKKSTEGGQCNQFHIEVKTEQVCDIWGEFSRL